MAIGAAPRARGGVVALGAWVALVCMVGVLLTALVGGRTAPATELANKVNTVRRALPAHRSVAPAHAFRAVRLLHLLPTPVPRATLSRP
jgi:hypothetical protein